MVDLKRCGAPWCGGEVVEVGGGGDLMLGVVEVGRRGGGRATAAATS